MSSDIETHNRINQTPAQPDKPGFTAADVIRAVDAYVKHGKLLFAAQMVARSAPEFSELAARHILHQARGDTADRRAALEALGFGGDRSNEMTNPYTPPVEQQPVISPDAASVAQAGNEGGVCLDDTAVWIDAELNRLMIALDYGLASRVYWTARRMNTNGSGWVEIAALVAELSKLAGITERTVLRHWLAKGEGVLWRIDWKENRLYYFGYVRLAGELTRLAVERGLSHLVETNRAGTRFISVPSDGDLKRWYGNSLAAWHNSRAQHTQNISRYTLEHLWNTTKKTLITWEKAVGIEVSKCYAQYTDVEHIPDHAYPTVVNTPGSQQKIVRFRARHSNMYSVPEMKERHHRTKPRKAYWRATSAFEGTPDVVSTPSSNCGGVADNTGDAGFSPTKRRNFFAPDGKPSYEGHKRLHKHLREHYDDQAAHFVRLGYHAGSRSYIFEQNSSGYQETQLFERVNRRAEDAFFAANGGRSFFYRLLVEGCLEKAYVACA